MTDKVESRSILISGGARGIGRGLARFFLNQGNFVFLLDIDADELHYTVDVHLKAHASADRLSYAVCDLRDVDDIRQKVKHAAEFLGGKIDVLISNAGIATPHWRDGKAFDDPATLDEWRAHVDTNLTAPFALSQAAIPFMKCVEDSRRARHVDGPGPCIVLIGSFRAHQSDPNQEGYAATKAGQLGLMHSMAVSCQPWGVRVNLVAPGRIKVAHESKEGDEKGTSWEDSLEDKDTEDHPANRAGSPEDVARAVNYLVGAGFVTGQELTVDGGALMRK